MDAKFKSYNKGNKKGILLMVSFIFVFITKLNALDMIGGWIDLLQINDLTHINKYLPAFVFYFNDSHIYLNKDTAMTKSLLHSNDKIRMTRVILYP